MINGISITTNEPSFEQIYASGCFDEETNHINALMVRADLDAGQQAIYDNFIGLAAGNVYFNIDNTTCLLALDRFTSEATVEGTIELDYATMSAPDKLKVDEFVNMAHALTAA